MTNTNTDNPQNHTQSQWWKSSLVYQIYPASFYCAPDTTCPPNDAKNAVGNIRGIIEKVPYIASLGFDAIWLSPIFASPQTDMGYDVSDYRSIHPPYGTVEDVQELIDTLHATKIPEPHGNGSRPMRLLMDLVVNHTSDQHPWFIESAASRTNPKSDWYFWRDPKVLGDGQRAEPNNWRSIFGGPAWHYVESRKQYYLALFLPSQPDLNWENVDMRHEIYADMKFWLDRGVDGWRIDSMNLMSKYPDLPDAEITQPDEKYQDGKKWYASGPKMHDYLQEIRREVFDSYGEDRLFTVGELGSAESEEGVAQYVAKSRHELHCVFHGMDLDFGPRGKYDGSDPFRVQKLRSITDKWQVAMPKFQGWNSVYLDNHDSGRSLTRYANDAPEYRGLAAKMLATYLCTLSGTVFALSGQEIGMANLPLSVGIDGYKDVEGQNWYHKILAERGLTNANPQEITTKMADVMEQLHLKARDQGRLPMQWTSRTANAGFCPENMTPWMTIHPETSSTTTEKVIGGEVGGEGQKQCEWTVEAQLNNPQSVMTYWKEMIRFRRTHEDILVHGSYVPITAVESGGEDILAYERVSQLSPTTSTSTPSSSSSSTTTTANNTGNNTTANAATTTTTKMAIFLSFAKENIAISSEKYSMGWEKVFGNYHDDDSQTDDRSKSIAHGQEITTHSHSRSNSNSDSNSNSNSKLVLRPYEALILKQLSSS